MCVYRKSNNNNTWFRIIKASKQKKCGFEVERCRDDIIYTHEKKLMSEIQQHLNCKLSTSSIVCRNFSLWDYPFNTSASFYNFWSRLPPIGSFLLLSIGKFDQFLTPPLKNADVVNGWFLFRNSNRYSMTYREMNRILIVVDEL